MSLIDVRFWSELKIDAPATRRSHLGRSSAGISMYQNALSGNGTRRHGFGVDVEFRSVGDL